MFWVAWTEITLDMALEMSMFSSKKTRKLHWIWLLSLFVVALVSVGHDCFAMAHQNAPHPTCRNQKVGIHASSRLQSGLEFSIHDARRACFQLFPAIES